MTAETERTESTTDTANLAPTPYRGRCAQCPGRTQLRPDPEALERARNDFDSLGLDPGIRDAVAILFANGVETFESCEGGPGHAFPEPTIRFAGEMAEGLRALSVALENGLPVFRLRRAWGVIEGELHGPWWEMTFSPPRPPGAMPWWMEQQGR